MNLPNKITVSRIALIPIFLIFLIPLPDWTNRYSCFELFNNFVASCGTTIAIIIFAIASMTDGIDGYIARKYNKVTNLGIFLDPIADKIMVISALIALVQRNSLSVWVTIIIIAREFIITGFRLVASDKKVVLAANKWGKLKTVSQITLIIVALLIENKLLVAVCSIFALTITIYSGWRYIFDNKDLLK